MGDHQAQAYRDAVDEAMSVEQVAIVLGIGRMQVNRLTRDLALPFARQVGRSWMYWPEDVRVMTQRNPSKALNDRHYLAALIREHGANEIGVVLDDFGKVAGAALHRGWHLIGWRAVSRQGLILFTRHEGQSSQVSDEVMTLREERRAIEAATNGIISTGPGRSDVFLRHERDARQNRLKTVHNRLKEIDPDAIAAEIRVWEGLDDSFTNREERIASLKTLQARIGQVSNPPLEAVLCINDDENDHWREEARAIDIPCVVLYREAFR